LARVARQGKHLRSTINLILQTLSGRIASLNQVNPYISNYSAPEGSKTGSVTRFRWEGPLSHKFVRDTIQAARWAFSAYICAILIEHSVSREGNATGLIAFSISAFDHVPYHSPNSRCKSCAGMFCSGVWALAENIPAA
jgi:hypothetical protein